jgi:transposase
MRPVTTIPDPEHTKASARPRYTEAFKRKVLTEVEQLQAGEIGAYLRKMGLYSGTLSRWRWERDSATMQSLAPRKRGPKPKQNAEQVELARLQRKIDGLEKNLAVAHEIIEVQKKISEIFKELSPQKPEEPPETG